MMVDGIDDITKVVNILGASENYYETLPFTAIEIISALGVDALRAQLAARDAELQRMREVVDGMKGVLMSGVTLMTLEQLSQWEGVRYWLEYTPGVTDNVTDGE